MHDPIRTLLLLIPGLPLAAAGLTALLGPRVLRAQSHWLVVAALAGSFVCSLLLVREIHNEHRALPEGSSGSFERVVPVSVWADVKHAYNQRPTVPVDSPTSVVESGWRDFKIEVVLRADALTAIMLSMVTFISTLVAIFAVGYMQGDRGYWRFFSYIGLFVFSMTMLVSVSNFLLLYVFWEAVGACSYLLIGFWYEKPEAAAAGKKAFLVNRVGDFGFALALFLIWTYYGTLNFHSTPVVSSESLAVGNALGDVPPDNAASGGTRSPSEAAREAQGPGVEQTPAASVGSRLNESQAPRGILSAARIEAKDYLGGGIGFAICLCLMLGACGKSAQFPLHVWLPDAMEGPTPVSALIHAATMVTAGVYMVTRCTPLFMASPDAQLVVACIGGFTALLAGLIALTQFDLKRVLAYSTVSQLGYMFLALGTGTAAGITAGMFHLFTHAFFKALLFLAAGSVMHAMHHIIDMRRFSGLRKVLPVTHATFAIGCLALAGIFPLSGFWSKDAVVASVHDKAHEYAHERDHRAELAAGESGPHGEDATANGKKAQIAQLSDGQVKCGAIVYQGLYYGALFVAFLTAFYTFRAFFMTFYGETRIPHEAGSHAHESPGSMTLPLAVLAGCAIVVGLFFAWPWQDVNTKVSMPIFDGFLAHTPSLAAGAVAETRTLYKFHYDVAALSTVVALAGIGVAAFLYLGDSREVGRVASLLRGEWVMRLSDVDWVSRLKRWPPAALLYRAASKVGLGWLVAALGSVILLLTMILSAPLLLVYWLSPYKLSLNKFYFDEIYGALVVAPLRMAASVSYWFDKNVIDGLVNLVGKLPPLTGSLMRSLQMGLVQFYALAMVLGVLILLAARALWAG